jgi:resuscitation-promoting factor RpfA
MGRTSSHETGRALAAAVTTTGLAVALGSAVPARVTTAVEPLASVEALVLAVVVTVAALAATVLAVGCGALLLTTLGRATGRRVAALDHAARALTPAVLRRVVAAGVGVGLGLSGAVTATAAESDLGWQPTTAPSAEVAPSPDATADPSLTALPAASLAAAQPVTGISPGEPQATRTVRAGDTLWDLAAAHLDPDATVAQVAAAWPRWYEANREVIGADPDLLLPGQVLHVPAGVTTDEAGVAR